MPKGINRLVNASTRWPYFLSRDMASIDCGFVAAIHQINIQAGDTTVYPVLDQIQNHALFVFRQLEADAAGGLS